jgi:hypothetical protein
VQPIAAKPQSPLTDGASIVAIVDDDPAVCDSLKFSLELEGFGVRAYGSAPEFLNAGDLAACDCVVIDQRMPAMKIARSQDPDAGDTAHQSSEPGAERPRRNCRCSCCRKTAAQRHAGGQDSRGLRGTHGDITRPVTKQSPTK